MMKEYGIWKNLHQSSLKKTTLATTT
jgi:hypothetical protein